MTLLGLALLVCATSLRTEALKESGLEREAGREGSTRGSKDETRSMLG